MKDATVWSPERPTDGASFNLTLRSLPDAHARQTPPLANLKTTDTITKPPNARGLVLLCVCSSRKGDLRSNRPRLRQTKSIQVLTFPAARCNKTAIQVSYSQNHQTGVFRHRIRKTTIKSIHQAIDQSIGITELTERRHRSGKPIVTSVIITNS